jgi:hypothetical protein
VELVYPNGNLVGSDSVSIPSGDPTYLASVNWSLAAGQQYYLLQTTRSNEIYISWGAAAPSDSEIAMTDTGDLSNGNTASTSFNYGGSAGNRTYFWADFQNITTTTAGVPEPASFILVLPFAAAVLLRARRFRS